MFTSSSPCREDQFAVSYFSTSLIGLIQVCNWEIRHHSLICCCGLADILCIWNLSTYLPNYLPTHLATFLPTYRTTYPSTLLATYSFTYLPSYLPPYLPTHLSTYPASYLPIPPSYLPTHPRDFCNGAKPRHADL